MKRERNCKLELEKLNKNKKPTACENYACSADDDRKNCTTCM
jgi:hypothetical protein